MDGLILPFPGFCYNRAVDFICYIWYKHEEISWDYYETFDFPSPINTSELTTPTTVNMSSPEMLPEDYFLDDTVYPDYYEETIITQSVSPFFLVLGSVGNLLTAVILYRLSKEVISTCLYLTVLSVMDLLVLYTRCGNEWLRSVSHLDITNMLMMNSPSICKVYPFVFSFVFHLMRWLVVCTAVEGVIATKYPHKIQHWCTSSKAEAVILLLTVLLICINIHFFWSFELIDADEDISMPGIMCTFNRHGHQSSEVFTNFVWPIIDTLVTDGIPSFIISVCVVIMIIQISKGHHRGDEAHLAWRRRYQMDPVAMDQLKITFLVICVLYIPATLPKMAVNLIGYLYENQFLDYDDYDDYNTKRNLANAICTNMEFAYLSMKFYLYLALSQRFRLEAWNLIKCSPCLNRRRGPKIKHTESMANEPLMSRDGCQRSNTENSLNHHPQHQHDNHPI